MTISEVTQLIFSLATMIGVVGTLVLGVMNRQSIEHVRHETNSMKDQLVAEVRVASEAKGLKKGREELR